MKKIITEQTKLTETQIKKIIHDRLIERYEVYRESKKNRLIRIAKLYRGLKSDLDDAMKKNDLLLIKKLQERIYGNRNIITKRWMPSDSFASKLRQSERRIIIKRDSSDEQIRIIVDDEINNIIKGHVTESMKMIKSLNPIHVSMCDFSKHDLELTIKIDDQYKKTFTINVSVSGGESKKIHLRTFKKIHKKVALWI